MQVVGSTRKGYSCHRFLLALASNVEKHSNSLSCFLFLSFSFLALFLDGLTEKILPIFHISLPRTCVTKIRHCVTMTCHVLHRKTVMAELNEQVESYS